MYPPKFDYYRASSVGEAISLMGQHPNAKFLAGGHSLIPILNLRLAYPNALIDIGFIDEMKGIQVTRDGGYEIGALTTHAEVAANRDVPTALSEAAGMIGDPQVRNRGTIGGNIAHADPASDLPTVLTALDATFAISGPGGDREVAAHACFLELFVTDIREGEILRSIRVRSPHPGRMFNDAAGSAYAKMSNPASRYAMVGAAAVIMLNGNVCESASVAIGGLTPSARRATSVEKALFRKELNEDTLTRAAEAVREDLGDDILGDIHASASYRQAMAPVYVKRALAKAIHRARFRS